MLNAEIPVSPPAPKYQPPRFLLSLVFLGLAVAAGFVYWFAPGFLTVPIHKEKEPELIWGNKAVSGTAVIHRDNRLYFNVKTLQEHLDPSLAWEPEHSYLTLTTKNKVVQMDSNNLTWTINQKPSELRFPLLMENGEPFLDLEPLKSFYHLNIEYISQTNRVIIDPLGQPLLHGTAVVPTPLRVDNSLRAPRFSLLEQGQDLIIIKEKDGWLQVRTASGLIGYVSEKAVVLKEVEFVPPPVMEKKPAWKPLGAKINLAWEQVVRPSGNPRPEALPSMPGVNVYSPTWFHLADAEGNITNYADLSLVKWAHSQGKQVWSLFSNSFDPELSADFLNNPTARQNAIRQLVILADLYNLDGINIDFENIPVENKELLVQFVRELTPMLHELDLVVSIDVTVKSTSGNWSRVYDRQALGKIVDYVAVMTYDEHWSTSPNAGSVASLPWVEKGLLGILGEVPAKKVLLGVPFYTRLWTETNNGETIEVSSKALSMSWIENWLKENRLNPTEDSTTGQNFAELSLDSKRFLVWLEDETSMKKRVELIHKYDLAGLAAWQRGFAKNEIWNAIKENLERKPY